jgi:hypothetical protein
LDGPAGQGILLGEAAHESEKKLAGRCFPGRISLQRLPGGLPLLA